MDTIIAFDPGRTTGIVVAECGYEHIDVTGVWTVIWKERLVVIDHLLESRAPITGPAPTVLIESFRLWEHMSQHQIGSQFEAVQVIGNIQMTCFKYSIPAGNIHYQPASIKQYVQVPGALKDLLTTEHTKDAFKHIRYFALSHYKEPDDKRTEVP
jgi:hypothetical protein